MSELISYCGLICQNCPIFLATRETNKVKKESMIRDIINMCREHYGIEYKYEDINDCDGCKSENVDNCAYCDEYTCEKLSEIFKTDPKAKTRLDTIRHKI